jgi:DNA-binding response OmpR family regulator
MPTAGTWEKVAVLGWLYGPRMVIETPSQADSPGRAGHLQNVLSSGVVEYGPLVLDPEGFSLTAFGRDVPLTYVEFLLLNELMHHPYRVIGPSRLLEVVNGTQDRGGVQTSPGALRTHFVRLRAKLAAAGLPCIKTMRRVGYGFVPPAG